MNNNEINKASYDIIAQNYQSEHGAEDWEKELNKFVELLPIKDQTVLDLGCGPGDESCWLSEHLPDATIIGVDISPEMLKLPKDAPSNVSFIEADIATYIPEHKIAGIWARASLHHLTHKQISELFKNASEYLLPGGLIGMINKYGFTEEFERKGKYGALLERYFQYFDEGLVKKIVSENNLELVDQYTVENDHKWLVSFLRKPA